MRRLVFVFPLVLCLAACGGDSDNGNPVAPTDPPQPFTITELRAGTGAEAVAGKAVTVHYAGWLYSATAQDNKGSLFDSSVGRTPYTFTLGSNAVIRGFDQGVTGMKVGAVRRVVIPPDLGYGASGNGPIPPNANLVFEIELLDVQ